MSWPLSWPESKKAFYTEEINRYKKRRRTSRRTPKTSKPNQRGDKKSDDEMHQHHRWAQATTAL